LKERIFITEWKNSIRVYFPNAHVFKIPDQPMFSGVESRFTLAKPYDLFALIKGKFFAFECKLMRTLTAFPFDRVAEHQLESLWEVKRAGGFAYVVINYRCDSVPEKTTRKFSLESKRYMKVFLFDIDNFDKLSAGISAASLSFEAVLAHGKIFNRGSLGRDKGGWDVSKLSDVIS